MVFAEPELMGFDQRALANAGAFLQPLADIAAQKFGAAVSILLALPIGSKGGKVELRR